MKQRPAKLDLSIAVALFVGTLALYGRVVHFDFINFDDSGYTYENPRVQRGLTADNIGWAFVTGAESNWHPLTWLSLMLDVSIFGMKPGWMHLENVVLHATSAVLLFIALLRMTQARWPSAWVAGMFAWHPLHVESVAWISERKDVLSTLFMMLCLLAYARWVRAPNRNRYLLVLGLLVLGLLAKPMLVTLPCLLLLLDYWPLARIRAIRDARKCVIEKLPMFAIVLASSVATYIAQSAARSVAGISSLPIGMRVANASLAYVKYLQLTIVPRGLAIFYPLPTTFAGGRINLAAAMVCAGMIVVITVAALALRRRCPWLAVGWLWYLGTLVPVIGLVQVGSQSHADRYTYVPLIGIFIAVAWGAVWLARQSIAATRIMAILAIASTVSILPVTWRQIEFWKDSVTLMQHAVDVVPNNYVALASLGEAYDRRGDHARAEALYRQTLQIRPGDPMALYNLAIQAAERHDDPTARKLFHDSLFADPTYGPAYNNYGNVLMRLGERDNAIEVYRAGISHDADSAPLKHNLALALAETGKLDEAIGLWRAAIAIDRNYTDAHKGLGNALIMQGQTRQGINELRETLRLHPDDSNALKSLAWTLATHPSPMFQNASEAQALAARAVELQPNDPVALDTLAAAYARGGRFDDAVATAGRASSLASKQDAKDLLDPIQQRIKLYQSGQPFTSR